MGHADGSSSSPIREGLPLPGSSLCRRGLSQHPPGGRPALSRPPSPLRSLRERSTSRRGCSATGPPSRAAGSRKRSAPSPRSTASVVPARPPGRWQLCHVHDTSWRDRASGRGVSFEHFLATGPPPSELQPLPGGLLLPACRPPEACGSASFMTASGATRAARGAQAFEAWAARARQPANHRVLSLRGLPELVRLELLYAISCRVSRSRCAQRPATCGAMSTSCSASRRWLAARARPRAASTRPANRDYGRFPRFTLDRIRLAYGDADGERQADVWDLRHFGRSGRLDFSCISQEWLRERQDPERLPPSPTATTSWCANGFTPWRCCRRCWPPVAVAAMTPRPCPGPTSTGSSCECARPSPPRPASPTPPGDRRPSSRAAPSCCANARDMGLVTGLAPTFAIRRGDAGAQRRRRGAGPGHPTAHRRSARRRARALRAVPRLEGGPTHHTTASSASRAGEMAVLAYAAPKGTGRRVGEVASLHLECLDTDEQGKPVLVYDNHKAMRMGRRLPLADSALVEAIRDQQSWVRGRFAGAPPASCGCCRGAPGTSPAASTSCPIRSAPGSSSG